MTIAQAKIISILPTAIWIESDMMGTRHVMLQHEGMDPFTYCSFYYNYAYTSNAGTHDAAEAVARSLGANEPITHRSRDLTMPTLDEAKAELAAIQEYIKEMEGGAA